MSANFDEGAWIVTGYIIAAVIVIPLTPWLQQLFGRRQYYVGAIVGFTIASISVRHLDVARRARLFPRRSRLVRRRPDRNRPGDHARHLSCQTARTEPGTHVDRSGHRTVNRPDLGRRLDRQPLVELGFLHQHRPGHRIGAALRGATSQSRAARAPEHRRRWPRTHGDGTGVAAVRLGRRRAVRLVRRPQHHAHRRHRGRFARGVCLVGAASRAQSDRRSANSRSATGTWPSDVCWR